MLAENLEYYAEMEREGFYKALFLAIVSEKEMAISSALYKVAGIPLNTANHFPQPSMFTDEDVAKNDQDARRGNDEFRNCRSLRVFKKHHKQAVTGKGRTSMSARVFTAGMGSGVDGHRVPAMAYH